MVQIAKTPSTSVPFALRVEKDAVSAQPASKSTKRDREVIEEIGKTGRYLAPGVLDPYTVLDAEENVALRHAKGWKQYDAIRDEFDAKRTELGKTVPRNMADRLEWAKDQLKKQVDDQKGAVAAAEKKVDELEAKISKLYEADGRNAEERKAKEPPHPPWRKIEEAKKELESAQEAAGIEKKLLRELEKELPGKLRDLDRRIAEEKDTWFQLKKSWRGFKKLIGVD
jgi:chromosome segregation ATPase